MSVSSSIYDRSSTFRVEIITTDSSLLSLRGAVSNRADSQYLIYILSNSYLTLTLPYRLNRMQQMAQREKNQAMRWEDEQIAAINARANQIQELNLLGISQVTNAQIGHKDAVTKGNIVATKMKQYMRSENDIIDANHTRRIEAVLSLKDNTAISRKEVKDSAGKKGYNYRNTPVQSTYNGHSMV